MLLGVIADDFTGASDIANTLAKGLPEQGGLVVAQYQGLPSESAAAEIEAGVIALKSRSIAADDAIAQSIAALRWLLDQGCEQIVFKYCSTFDSTPAGNIGPVAEALANALGVRGVLACPAAPALGRTIHMGHLFVHDRLISESGMQHHPLTPMTDPDIRRWLARQTKTPVGHVPISTVRAGVSAVRESLVRAASCGETLVIADAAIDDDLLNLGQACRGARLISGGSGIALGLPANFIAEGKARGSRGAFAGVDGPAVVLAGSCSAATRRQIEAYAQRHPALRLDIDAVMASRIGAADLTAFLTENLDRSPMVYSSGDPDVVAKAQTRYGGDRLADTLDRLFADTARNLVTNGLRRLVVAGGETSGAVTQALNLGPLTIGPEIEPGVPILMDGHRKIALALKSGNFGGRDFFANALAAMQGAK